AQVILSKETKALDLLARPEVTIYDLYQLPKVKAVISPEAHAGDGALSQHVFKQALEQIEVQIKYAGYIDKQTIEIQKCAKHENTQIPEDFIYKGIPGLSAELIEKLTKSKPKTLGVASRIPGVTPAAISLLLIYIKKFVTQTHEDEVSV
ncbi:MAG TPA: hypothetical protein PLD88_04595, partial [Candidatus Berkiella sp.]|nr:hypothetical protein [Candidatus Berkiella sp.]